MSNVKAEVLDFHRRFNQLRHVLMLQVLGLPDNPRVQRLGKNCFTIKSSQLGGNWLPEYHDFKWQYQKIVEILNEKGPDSMISFVEEIIRSGSWRYKGTTITFHPEVVGHLRTLWEAGDGNR